MKITIKVDELRYDREIPTRWAEVTWDQFLKMSDCTTETETFAAILGLDMDTMNRAKIKNAGQVLSILAFLKNTKPELTHVPARILGYTIPKDLETETIQIYEHIKAEMRDVEDKKDPKAAIRKYPLYIAMFVCEQSYGGYSYDKSVILSEVFMKAPALEVLAVGNFTILKLIGLNRGTNLFARKAPSRLRNLKLAFKALIKNMAFTIRYAILKRRLGINDTNS
jgi:hypothetical protein